MGADADALGKVQCGDGTCGAGEACDNGVCAATGPCGGYTYQGCCEGQTVIWCEDDEVLQFDCGADGGCGWDASTSAYDCSTDGAADPDGVYPKACP